MTLYKGQMTGQRWIPAWDRFWSRVTEDPDTHCWVWNGDLKKRAKVIMVDGVEYIPYWWSYLQFVGDFDPSLTLDHLCYNPGCVNPWHLEPVPLEENVRRAREYYASLRTMCVAGKHPWPENAAFPAASRPYCRECRKERRRGSKERERNRERSRERYQNDPEYREKVLARNRARHAEKGRKDRK